MASVQAAVRDRLPKQDLGFISLSNDGGSFGNPSPGSWTLRPVAADVPNCRDDRPLSLA
jgi:hypothetical protein